MLMAAKHKGHGEEGKRKAQEEDGKEKLKDTNQGNDTHRHQRLSALGGTLGGLPSLKYLHPWQNNSIH